MNRDAAVTAGVALLAVLALALGAATLDPLDAGSGPGDSEDGVAGPGEDNEFRPGGQPTRNASSGGEASLPPLFGRLFLALALIAGLIGLYGLYTQLSLREVAGIVAGVAVLGLVLYALTQVFGGGAPGQNGTFGGGPMKLPSGGGGGSGVPGDSTGTTLSDPPFVVLAAFGLVLVGGAVIALRSAGGDSPEPDPDPAADDGEDVAALGRAAGRAADRIDADADTRNEVYRAWEEMTDLLDVPNPETSTPEEFADAAVDTGMRRGDVSELTDLFRNTRYGGRAVTDDRAARAAAAFRRIEAEYTDAEPGTETDANTAGNREGSNR